MLVKSLVGTVGASLQAVTTIAEAVNETASMVKNVAQCGNEVSEKWREHTVANISFDDDEE